MLIVCAHDVHCNRNDTAALPVCGTTPPWSVFSVRISNQNKNNPTFVLLPPHRSKELKKDPDVDMCIHHTLVWLNGWSMAETDPSHCCCAARVSSKWLDIQCQGSTHREFVEPMSKATTASTNLVIWLSPFPVASAPASRAASQARAILGRKHNMPRFAHMDGEMGTWNHWRISYGSILGVFGLQHWSALIINGLSIGKSSHPKVIF